MNIFAAVSCRLTFISFLGHFSTSNLPVIHQQRSTHCSPTFQISSCRCHFAAQIWSPSTWTRSLLIGLRTRWCNLNSFRYRIMKYVMKVLKHCAMFCKSIAASKCKSDPTEKLALYYFLSLYTIHVLNILRYFFSQLGSDQMWSETTRRGSTSSLFAIERLFRALDTRPQ